MGNKILEGIAQITEIIAAETTRQNLEKSPEFSAPLKQSIKMEVSICHGEIKFQIENGTRLAGRNLQTVRYTRTDEYELICPDFICLIAAIDSTAAVRNIHNLTAFMGMKIHMELRKSECIECRESPIDSIPFQFRPSALTMNHLR